MQKFLFHLKVLKTYIQVHLGIGMFRYMNAMGLVFWGGGGKGSAPDAPDYSQMAKATERSAELAKEAADNDLKFRYQVYNDNLPRVQQLMDMANQVSGKQSSILDQSMAIADQNNKYYNNTFQPIEQQTVMDSMGSQYLSDVDRQQLTNIMNGTAGLSGANRTLVMDNIARNAQNGAANQAMLTAGAQANSAYSQQAQNLARMGLDPSRLASAAASLAQNQTLNSTNAANQARSGAFAQQQGLRGGVANFGRNMPNTAAQSYGLANQAGNSAVGNMNTGAMGGLPYANYVSGGAANQINAAGIGVQGQLGVGNLMNQGYNTQMNAYLNQDNFLGGLMGMGTSLGSAAILRGSDRIIKENIIKIGELDNGLNLYAFEYKSKFKDKWGHGQHLGVMADEVERVMPEAVTLHQDGYKMVDYRMIGAA